MMNFEKLGGKVENGFSKNIGAIIIVYVVIGILLAPAAIIKILFF